MKSTLLQLATLLVQLIFLFSCAEEEKFDSKTVRLTFSFNAGENKESQINSVKLPDGASLLINLETESGEVVLAQHHLTLQKQGEVYVSPPVELKNGNYKITDFLVIDDSLGVIFATPRTGSPLSGNIRQSLPYRFRTDDQGSDLRFEVLDAKINSSRNFGYDSFNQNKGPLKLQVFIPSGQKLQMTTAEALVMKGLDTMQVYPLSAKMNTLTFNGDPGEIYTLVVVKDSYARFTRDFNVNDKMNQPLKIILEPALSVVAIPKEEDNYFGIQFDTWYSHTFNVDWGDGTNETWTSGLTVTMDHYYQEPGKYFISITGHALDSVLLVGDLYGGGEIERLGMDHLYNLFDFRIEWADGPKVIDLSHSTFLSEVRIFTAAVEDLIIPNNARIYILEIVGDTNLKQESFEEIINDLHYQVVNSPPHTGDFAYNLPGDLYTPILEPSPESLDKLRDMRDNYGWYIWPDTNL